MNTLSLLLAIIFMITATPAPLWADPSRAGGILLQQPFGARPFALGQAYAAIGDDAFGALYNPAILGRLKQSQVGTEYIQGLVDNQSGYGIFATPLNPTQAVGIGAAYFDGGKADIFDASGQQTRAVNFEQDILLHLDYAHSFSLPSGRIYLGAGGKLLRSVIADEMRATGYAADAGLLYERPLGRGAASIATVVSNLGSGLSYSGGVASGSASDPLPLTTRLAFGYARGMLASDKLTLGLETDRVFYDDLTYESLGMEYDYHHYCALRLGYRFGQNENALTLGLGVIFQSLSLDYGFGLSQTFNNTHQISVNYRFTIPGIRYSEASPPSPLEQMVRNTQDFIEQRRLFSAAAEADRIAAFFPDSDKGPDFKKRIESEADQLIMSGNQSKYYFYALAYKKYRAGLWEEAVSQLEASLRLDSDNREIPQYLKKAKENMQSQQKQMRLQQQATISTLFELANQAFESGDYARAKRITGEILRVVPYQPAESLNRRIAEATRRPPVILKPPTPSRVQPSVSPQDIATADELYNEAIRIYAEAVQKNDTQKILQDLQQAIDDLEKGIRLNPNSEYLRNTLDLIRKELNQRRNAGNSP